MNIAESWDQHLEQLEAARENVSAARRQRSEAKEAFSAAGIAIHTAALEFERDLYIVPQGWSSGFPGQPDGPEDYLPCVEKQLRYLEGRIKEFERYGDDRFIQRGKHHQERLQRCRDRLIETRDALIEADAALAAAEGELEEIEKAQPRSNQQALAQLAKRADQIGEDLERGRENMEAAEAALQQLEEQRAGLDIGDLLARAAMATGKEKETADKALAEAESTFSTLDLQVNRQRALVEGLQRWLTETEAAHHAAQESYRAAAYEARVQGVHEAERALVALLADGGPVAEAVARINTARSEADAVAPEGTRYGTAILKITPPTLYGEHALDSRIELR